MPKTRPTKEQRKAIRDARKLIEQAIKMDVNEAETRKRVDSIFEWIMGYDVFKHVSREHAVKGAGETEHVDFAIQIEPGPDAEPLMMVELKRVGIELAKKHLKQVTSYAINEGCEWVLLTNGKAWRLYHVEFGQPPKVELLDSWDLLENEVDDLIDKFAMISYKSVKRGMLHKNWERVKVLKPETLLEAIASLDTLKTIRKNLRKNTGVFVDEEEVFAGIGKLLNEAAGNAISKIKIGKSAKRAKKPKATKSSGTNNEPSRGTADESGSKAE